MVSRGRKAKSEWLNSRIAVCQNKWKRLSSKRLRDASRILRAATNHRQIGFASEFRELKVDIGYDVQV